MNEQTRPTNSPEPMPLPEQQAIVELIQANRLQEAEARCSAACEHYPQEANAWYLLSTINGMLGNYTAVEEYSRRCISLAPEAHAAYINLGNALALQNRTEEAETAFQESLRLNPDDPQTLVNRGNLLRQRGDLEQAIDSYRTALSLQPDFPEVHNNLAGCLQEKGNLEAAKASYEAALRINPSYPDALANFATLNLQLGDTAAARENASRALELNPHHANACLSLASALVAEERPEEALATLDHALSVNPGAVDILCRAGQVLMKLGRYDQAVEKFSRALEIQRDSAQANLGLGRACQAMGDTDRATAHYLNAVRAKPDFIEAHISLGGLHYLADRNERAIDSYRRALDLDPEQPDALCGLASALAVQGNFEEAAVHLDRVLEIEPGHPEALITRADIHEKQGDFEAAYQSLQPLVDEGRTGSRLAVAFASIARHLDRGQEAIDLMERALAGPDLTVKQQQDLHFALGKALDAAADFDRAFAHYADGNRLVKRHFDPAGHNRLLDALIACYDTEGMRSMPRSDVDAELPVFIVGMPRSGTSLVEQVLASHPDVHGAGELTTLSDIASRSSGSLGFGNQYPVNARSLTREELAQHATDYLEHLKQLSPDARLVTDKMPYNYMLLGFIELLFPNARVIHCRRHPLDTCLSCYFQYFAGRHDYAYELEFLGHYYNGYRRLMAHWEQVLNIRLMHVDYEDMVTDQESTTRRLLDFCGLDWHDDCLNFHRQQRHVKTASYDQVRRPMYRSSLERWTHYEKHLAPLTEVLKQQGNV